MVNLYFLHITHQSHSVSGGGGFNMVSEWRMES